MHFSALVFALILYFPFSSNATSNQCTVFYNEGDKILETPYGNVTITSETALTLLRDQQSIQSAMRLRGPEKIRALLTYAKQKTQSRVNTALTFVNYATALYLTHDIAIKIADNPQAAISAAALVPLTLVASDAVSSAYHYFLDNWASSSNPIWGPAATAFRRHHEVPNNLSQTGFIQNVSAFSKLMAPLYIATAVAAPHLDAGIQTQALVALLLFSHGTEIHRQAHLSNPNKFVQWFQNRRILLGRETHNLHHSGQGDSDYGIINGATNSSTNKFYERLNTILSRLSGRLPGTWLQTPRKIPDSVVTEMLDNLHDIPQELIVSAATSKHSDARIDEVLRLWIEKFGDSAKNEGTQNAIR